MSPSRRWNWEPTICGRRLRMMLAEVLAFHKSCREVLEHSTGKFSEYAKSYAEAGLRMDEPRIITSQALRILVNLDYWRGAKAREVKAELKRFK
jgi:hypothetical protein